MGFYWGTRFMDLAMPLQRAVLSPYTLFMALRAETDGHAWNLVGKAEMAVVPND